jgi:hypothetical protein
MLIGIDASRSVVARRTGTERYSLEIIRALIDVAPDEHFVLYFNQPPTSGLLPRSAQVRWRVIPSPRLWTVGRLALEMAVRPPDVLFVPSHSLPPVVPRATVTTIHDLGYLDFPDEHPRLTRWLRRLSNRWSARRATRVVAISGATRDALVRHDAASGLTGLPWFTTAAPRGSGQFTTKHALRRCAHVMASMRPTSSLSERSSLGKTLNGCSLRSTGSRPIGQVCCWRWWARPAGTPTGYGRRSAASGRVIGSGCSGTSRMLTCRRSCQARSGWRSRRSTKGSGCRPWKQWPAQRPF